MRAQDHFVRTSKRPFTVQRKGTEHIASLAEKRARGSLPNPVRAFLDRLVYPLGRLGDAFRDFGITGRQELDVFSEMQDEWVVLQAFLFEKHGVTPLEWMVIKAGLEARAGKEI